MRISDWSSDVCSSDLIARAGEVADVGRGLAGEKRIILQPFHLIALDLGIPVGALHQPHVHHSIERVRPGDHRPRALAVRLHRSEEHTSELQSLMRISYAVFCLKKKNKLTIKNSNTRQYT